jgi:hypothetical protein
MPRCILTAFVLASLAAVALAQPSRPAPSSWQLAAQVYLGDETLQKDLKLTPRQKLTANDLARGASARLVARLKEPAKAAEQDKQIRKDLDDFLKPAQVMRLRQVILQHFARSSAGSRSLAADAEVVKDLKLDDGQVRKLQGGAAFLDVLNDGQKKGWAKLIGKPFEARLQTGLTPVVLPVVLQYLSSRDVAANLKLGKEQQKDVEGLKAKYRKALAAAADSKKRRELSEAGDKEARDLLTAEQAKRLDQIRLQLATADREDALLSSASVAEKVKPTDEQRKKIRQAFLKRREEMLSLFVADGDAPTIRRKAKAFQTVTKKQLEAILDEKQRETLMGLVGEPFTGRVRIVSAGQKEGEPAVPEGLPLGPLLRSAAVAKELKLSAEQQKEFAEALKGRTEAVEQTLAKLLDDGQKRRLRQIVLRATRDQGGVVLLEPDVAKALKLTSDQKERLEAIRDEASEVAKLLLSEYAGLFSLDDRTGELRDLHVKGFAKTYQTIRRNAVTKSEAVLNKEQKKQLEELLGPPLATRE